MKILIILPNWLGDAIMTTPAIELLSRYYPHAKMTFVGSYASIEALKYHPQCQKTIVDETKKSRSRLLATYKLAKELGTFDIAISFRNQLHASLLLSFTGTVITIARRAWHSLFLLSHTPSISTNQHLSLQYATLAMINTDGFTKEQTPPLKLYIEPQKRNRPTLGINAGATYGSAKRWYPERFAEVAKAFADHYEIIIFGGPNETEIASEIEKYLRSWHVEHLQNLAGKTSIKELCSLIATCSLFVTNDSGPMHIAAAYEIPTVAIFGPTKDSETSQWMNKKSRIVRHAIKCAPCMKRVCPLEHHECMQRVTSAEVIEALRSLEGEGEAKIG